MPGRFQLPDLEVIPDADREHVKQLIREFWFSRGTITFIALILAALVCIFQAMLIIQRRDYETHMDAVAIRSLEQIRRDLQAMKLDSKRSDADRKEIRTDVEAVRKAVESP